MSKIGRKPILLSSAKVAIKDHHIELTGPKGKLTHDLPESIKASVEGNSLILSITEDTRENRMQWGLHRALLANKVKGVETGFEINLRIVGLGFKAQMAGKKLTLSLGYSHKIDYDLPAGVDVAIDKSGQLLSFKAIDKNLLGRTCDTVRSFRPPEPYKGTGIMRDTEVVRRKAGKTKSAS